MLRRLALVLCAACACACSSSTAPPTGAPSPASSASTVNANETVQATTAPTSAAPTNPNASISGYAGESWSATAASFGNRVGERFTYRCPADGVNWYVYGTDVYTSDSSVCTAAVHVGLITLVQGGTATIEIRPGQDSYTGSDRNGIHSAQYGPWDASYVFVDSSGVAIVGVDAQPSAGASATATFAPTGSPASSGATPGATVTALDADLLTPGQLAICMPFDRLLFAERDSDGKPFGVDVEIGLAIAEQLALTPEFVEVAFEDLIPAILDSECDVTIGGQFITAARLALIDMVPYREGTQHVVVKAGNPLAIERLTDLCGRSVAIVQGTIHAEILGGISDDCTASGQSAVVIATYPSEAEAENALASGETDAYIGNDFVTVERPADFERSAELPKLRNGIGHQVNLPTLDEAIRDALRTIIGNGAYDAILEKYGVTQVRLTELP